jgi:hypothetical protein
MPPDKKALQILFKTYWSPRGGWTAGVAPDAADYDYAKQKNYMFDPVKLTHDQIVQRLLRIRVRVSLQEVSEAFVASLSTRRLELRSALGSFAYAANFPDHQIASSPSRIAPTGNIYCKICGAYDEGSHGSLDPEDLSLLNFERFKWGGVRHGDPLYAAFDLELFAQAERLQPTPEDYQILNSIIETAQRLALGCKPGDLCKAISKLLPSNDPERRTLVQILALCGVLAPTGRPGFLQKFATADHVDRDRPNDHRNDWGYPAVWWTAADRTNAKMVSLCFPRISKKR